MEGGEDGEGEVLGGERERERERERGLLQTVQEKFLEEEMEKLLQMLQEKFSEEEKEKLLKTVRESVQKKQEERERMNKEKMFEKCTRDVLEKLSSLGIFSHTDSNQMEI
ncbi:uncharacterized protein LOC131614622 [Vicia villosa]|uniref:uncharacterized protein LOC131614622 n=1 Tax=Vicia villosa TaxID=3911 RepID=UPI00273CE77A|nr:uncharacterized protein LOC131614622 [Vicia villosa]